MCKTVSRKMTLKRLTALPIRTWPCPRAENPAGEQSVLRFVHDMYSNRGPSLNVCGKVADACLTLMCKHIVLQVAASKRPKVSKVWRSGQVFCFCKVAGWCLHGAVAWHWAGLRVFGAST